MSDEKGNYSKRQEKVAPFKGNWILESEKFLLVETGILGSGMRKTAEGIRNPTYDWNPESKFHWQRIRYPGPGIQNPRLSWILLHGAKKAFSV